MLYTGAMVSLVSVTKKECSCQDEVVSSADLSLSLTLNSKPDKWGDILDAARRGMWASSYYLDA